MKPKRITQLIVIHPKDNVATAISSIKGGTSLSLPGNKRIVAKEGIPFGHKMALRKIPKGSPVVKYGERIGKSICAIRPGEWVHVHNIVGERGRRREN